MSEIRYHTVPEPRLEIANEAASWVGTPYHHQACIKGKGVDCAMLIYGVARKVGLIGCVSDQIPPYSPYWHLHHKDEQLLNILESFGCTRKESEKREIGDILTFRFGLVTSHLGILVPNNKFIHAHIQPNEKQSKVEMVELGGRWKQTLTNVYNFPGVQ